MEIDFSKLNYEIQNINFPFKEQSIKYTTTDVIYHVYYKGLYRQSHKIQLLINSVYKNSNKTRMYKMNKFVNIPLKRREDIYIAMKLYEINILLPNILIESNKILKTFDSLYYPYQLHEMSQ